VRRRFRCSVLIYVLFFVTVLTAADQQQTSASSDVPVFRTGTRLVLVDVIATDSNGKPIHGLKVEDFTVLDNGKPQTIRSFDEHRADMTPSLPEEAPPELPAGVFSNWAPVPRSSSVNIILFDSLNTNWQDQAYARMQMIDYLKTLPSGEQVALYTLGNHLRMVQSFTGRSDTLIAAAKKLGSLSRLNAIDAGTQADTIAELKGTMPPGLQDFGNEALDHLQEFLQEETDSLTGLRTELTLEALRELARSVATVPGRKNLIWVSGGFPLTIGSYTERSTPMRYDRELRKTTALLAAHQIAIYPIDARGLLTPVVSAERTGRQVTVTTEADAAAGFKAHFNQFSDDLLRAHATMDELAEQTGGRAFYNTNGISTAISSSIDSGSNYYTIAYSPASKGWDGQLRKISVKTSRKDINLVYRHGYYAVADPFAPVLEIKTTGEDVQKRLIEAVQPNAPQTTSLILKVRAQMLVPTDKGMPVEIDYVMDAHGFKFPLGENGTRNLRYQLVVVAWDDGDKNAGQAWQMLNLNLSPEAVADALRNGLHSSRLLTLNPGMYQVYVGVIDENSKKIGSLVIPLRVPKH
jgi:VWFA-related protein